MLRYITFDQLMASVESDLRSYADNGMINRGNYIKTVRKVNADIGLKINKEKETVIDIKDFKGDLPADFLFLQMAVICKMEQYYTPPSIMGTHTVEKNIPVDVFNPNHGACMNENSGIYWVSQQFRERVIKYDRLVPLKLTKRSMSHCSENCINFNWNNSPYDIDIDYENGEIITNIREGKIYISYLCDMVDEDGNLLVLFHPTVMDYYEYSVKKKVIEDLLFNNDVEDRGLMNKFAIAKDEMTKARNNAFSFVNMPEYDEIEKVYQSNRKRFYNKYARMFN